MQLFSHGVAEHQGPEMHRYVINQNGSSDNEYLGFSLMVKNGRYDFWLGGKYLATFKEIRFK